jgi:hypothetical protein
MRAEDASALRSSTEYSTNLEILVFKYQREASQCSRVVACDNRRGRSSWQRRHAGIEKRRSVGSRPTCYPKGEWTRIVVEYKVGVFGISRARCFGSGKDGLGDCELRICRIKNVDMESVGTLDKRYMKMPCSPCLGFVSNLDREIRNVSSERIARRSRKVQLGSQAVFGLGQRVERVSRAPNRGR